LSRTILEPLLSQTQYCKTPKYLSVCGLFSAPEDKS
jgi:hypothetical protein